MTILDTLAKEHRHFETLLTDLAATSREDGSIRVRLFSELQSTLIAHARAEEEVVYRVLRERLPDEQLVLEGYEEHHIADVMLQELAAACPGGRGWAAKARVFEEVLRHHIKEEELGLFPLITSVCSEHECATMDAEFRAVRHSGVEALIGPLRMALPAFAGRALVDLQAIAGRQARRNELRILRLLEQRTALRNSLPMSIRNHLPDLGANSGADSLPSH
jgi:hemerythrin-like domain-containing protein